MQVAVVNSSPFLIPRQIVEAKCQNGEDIFVRPAKLGCPLGWQSTATRLRSLGARLTLRLGPDGQPFISDGGHYILEGVFGAIEDPVHLQQQLGRQVGVVENGLFLGLTSQVIVGSRQGVSILHPERTG